MELIALAVDPDGRRYELALTVPDAVASALDVGRARERLQGLLQTEVERAAIVAYVAHRDAEGQDLGPRKDNARRSVRARVERPADAGVDQIAFAGSKQPAVPVPAAGQE